jgi:DNA-binding GntR family transcriptional regulator
VSALVLEVRRTDGHTTAHEFARDTLRNEILSGKLRGGTRLLQSELAQRLNLSTTPVREALRDLATEGFVHIEPHRGTIVHQVDAAELREIYEMRRRLEPLVMELAIERITENELAAARDLHEQMIREHDPAEWVRLNRAFHGVFMDSCGWSRLAATVRSMHEGASPYVTLTMRFRPELMDKGNDDHRQILEACERRDVAASVALMEAHMDITKTALQERLPAGAAEPS